MQVLEAAGYTNLASPTRPDEYTLQLRRHGRLARPRASPTTPPALTSPGVDIWHINADESVAFEYSRYNYNATDFYQADQFRGLRPRPGGRRHRRARVPGGARGRRPSPPAPGR